LVDFKLPDLGEGLVEGEIVKWHIKLGDVVKKDQTLLEVETDKAVVDIPSPAAGKITKLKGKEGDTIKVGDLLVVIGGSKDKVSKSKEKTKSTSVMGTLDEPEVEIPFQGKLQKQSKVSKKILATPKVKALAKKLRVDLTSLKGTGKKGLISVHDVQIAAGKVKPITPQALPPKTGKVRKYDQYGYIDRIPLKGIRKVTAKKMVESVTNIPHVAHMDEVEVSKLVKLREKEKRILEEQGIKLTYLPFIIKAMVLALKEHPSLNASLEGEEILQKKYYNIGIAVDANREGLLVPVVKGADQKSIKTLAKDIISLAEKARSRRIDMADLKGGTFTITNIGSLGGRFATPIINYPEAAILGLGRMYEKVVPTYSGFTKKPYLPISLSFDHRILDGAEAARFVNKLFEYLQNPETMLVEE
tara:strand:- start:727 stop:1974 length:1248 start_codon:yes stop_codon:yes gene_type:complete